MSGSLRGVERAEARVRAVGPSAPGERPAAIVGGEPIGWDGLHPYLSEAAGAIALEELALDVLLAKECAARGVVIGEAEIDAERRMLETALASGDVGESARVVAQVRRARGLGPARWEGLLRRNAMLRSLVRGEVSAGEVDVAREYALRHGPRVRALLLTTRTAGEANAAAGRIASGELFSRVAAEVSTDASAARGGVIEPINLEDPTYPEALRRALASCADGGVTAVIALEGGYAVLRREGALGGDGPGLEAVRSEMEGFARQRQERALMGALARRTLEGARVGALDSGLRWSWEGRSGADNLGGR